MVAGQLFVETVGFEVVEAEIELEPEAELEAEAQLDQPS